MLYGELKTITLEDGTTHEGFRFQTLNPKRIAVLRLPTSDEMIARIDGQVSIRYDLGRRESKTEPVISPMKDLAFFDKIKVAGDDFSDIQARTSIAQLTANEVTDREREGDQYKITLTTPFGELAHWLKFPTDRDLFNYRRGAVAVTSREHNQDKIVYHALVGVELYDACFVKADGYVSAADIPAHHKFTVASELSAACATDEEFNPLS